MMYIKPKLLVGCLLTLYISCSKAQWMPIALQNKADESTGRIEPEVEDITPTASLVEQLLYRTTTETIKDGTFPPTLEQDMPQLKENDTSDLEKEGQRNKRKLSREELTEEIIAVLDEVATNIHQVVEALRRIGRDTNIEEVEVIINFVTEEGEKNEVKKERRLVPVKLVPEVLANILRKIQMPIEDTIVALDAMEAEASEMKTETEDVPTEDSVIRKDRSADVESILAAGRPMPPSPPFAGWIKAQYRRRSFRCMRWLKESFKTIMEHLRKKNKTTPLTTTPPPPTEENPIAYPVHTVVANEGFPNQLHQDPLPKGMYLM